MRRPRAPLLALLVSVLLAPSLDGQAARPRAPKRAKPAPERLQYPEARRDWASTERIGTTTVPDPYRWLETLEGPATAAWVAAEARLTERHLAGLSGRAAIRDRLTALWNHPRATVPFREGARLWYRFNDGLQRQSPVYSRIGDSVLGPEQLELDPNALFPDGATALVDVAPSSDGHWVAYGLADGGSDFRHYVIRNLTRGTMLPDTVRWVKFSGVQWTRDGRGFFYSRYPAPRPGQGISENNAGHKLYYHAVGTPQSRDSIVYSDPMRPDWIFPTELSEDGRWLFVVGSRGTSRNELHVLDLGDSLQPNLRAKLQPIAPQDDADYDVIGVEDRVLYVLTNRGAPKRRIVAVPLGGTIPPPAAWRVVVPEDEHVIEEAVLAGGRLVVHTLVDVSSRLHVWSTAGTRLREIELPGLGTVQGLSARGDSPELFYGLTSYLVPLTVYRHHVHVGGTEVFFEPKPQFDAARYETVRLFYKSKDGTPVPLFITARRDLPFDGEAPTILHGYGGFNVSQRPAYSPAVAAWLEMGGVFAVAGLRGGSEYGEAWHEAGMRERKQNVFDDFVAAADFLRTSKISKPAKLALWGRSNGGLLVGAVMTQRPDVAAVALPGVGVLDMLRFHRFSAGKFWTVEYGSPDVPAEARTLLAYSPLHNVKPGTCYPATLAYTADHDDRVVPSHTYKFIAALQHAQGCARPVLARIEVQGSHGYRPTDRQIAEYADLWAFTAAQLGMGAAAVP